MTRRAFDHERRVHRSRDRKTSIVISGREGTLRRGVPDLSRPVERTQGVVCERNDVRRRARHHVGRVEREMGGDVPGPEELEPVELQEVVYVENRSVALNLEGVVVELNQPEGAGEMEDRIGIINVLTIPRAEVVNLRARTGLVIQVNSNLAESPSAEPPVGADVLALVHPVVDVDAIFLPAVVDGRAAHVDLRDRSVEIGDLVWLCPDAVETVGHRPGSKLVNDPGAVMRRGREIIPPWNRERYDLVRDDRRLRFFEGQLRRCGGFTPATGGDEQSCACEPDKCFLHGSPPPARQLLDEYF